MGLKPGQEKCINTLDRSLVVAAGAGSGKTFTLTKRIVGAIQSGAVDGIERVCAITFTNKAAGELKSRIKSELRACGLMEQSLKVDEAWVSTIHGMCARILRAHAVELDIDPLFEMADAASAEALRDRAIDAVLSAAQSHSGDDFPFESDSLPLPDATSIDALFREYPARSTGFGTSSVESMVKLLMGSAGGNVRGFDAFVVPESSVNVPYLVDVVLDEYAALVDLTRAQKPNEAREAWADSAQAQIREIQTRMQEGRAPDAAEALLLLDGLPTPKKSGTADYKEHVARALEQYRTCVMELRLAAAAPHLDTLLALARCAQQLFAYAKRRAGLLDNDDLLVLASQAITTRPEIAAQYTDKFQLVMVDEFQDTDQMQLDMIKLLSGEGACRLCTVGDAQQSIYRFRGADVSVYRRHVRQVAAGNPEDVIELPDNFRSSPDVLSLVDRVFERPAMFGGEFMSLAPGRDEARVRHPFAEGVPRVQVQLTSTAHRNGASFADVRRVAAARIAEYFADLRARGHSAGEMAVLLGGMTNADVYASALRERGLACVISGGSVFSHTAEAAVVLDLVRVISNPYRTQPLHNVLTGPLFGLCASDLLELATLVDEADGSVRRRNLYAGLISCSAQLNAASAPATFSPQLILAVRVMSHVVRARSRSTVSRIVARAIADSGWLTRLQADGAEGLARAANAYKAIRMLRDIERASAAGPAYVAQTFEAMLAQVKEAPGALSAAGGDFVRIMTVHASKGLEFPIVAVAEFKDPRAASPKLLASQVNGDIFLSLDLGNSLTALEGSANIGKLGELYASMVPEDADEDTLQQTIAQASGALELRSVLSEYDRIGEAEESKRLLYVALTRAKEALVVSLLGKSTKDNPNATPKSCLGALVAALAGEGGSFAEGRSLYDYRGSAPAVVEHVRLVPDERGDTGEPDEAGQQHHAQATGVDQEQPATFFVAADEAWPHVCRTPYAPAHEGVFSYSSIADASHEGDVLDQLARRSFVSADEACQKEVSALWFQPAEDDSAEFDFSFSWDQANRNAALAEEGDGTWAYAGAKCDDADKATDLGTAFHRLAQYAVATRHACRDTAAADVGEAGAAMLVKPDTDRIRSLVRACRLDETQVDRLNEALDRWFQSDKAAEVAAFEDLRAEVPFFVRVPMASADADATAFLEGEIDLLGIDATQSIAHVVDYKTGGRDDETQEELSRKHVLQAACYAYAIMLQGIGQVTADFVRVERKRLDSADEAASPYALEDGPGQPQCVRYHFAAADLPFVQEAIASVYAMASRKGSTSGISD